MSEIASGAQSVRVSRLEIRERAEKDLNFLASLCMPTIVSVLFPPVHLAIWNLLLEHCNAEKIFRLLLGLPRGHAKTTLIKLFVLYLILFTNHNFILIICASQPKADNFLSDVTDMLDETNIQEIFGDWRLTLETDQLNLKKFSFLGKDVILAATGQGSVRGLNIKNRRPTCIIMDDVQDKENAESPVESHKLLNWIQSTVMKLRDPKRCFFIYIGNKYKVSPDCICVLEKLQNNPMWVHVVIGALLADGEPIWPELHSRESIMEEFENDFNMGTPEVFLSEVMNDTEANLNALIDLTKIPISPYDTEDNRVLCRGRFVIIDVATNKIGADDTVIGLHGFYENRKVNLEKLKFGSLSPMDTIKEALKMCFEHGANLIAVENSAYQSSLLFWFNEVCRELGIGEGLHFVEVNPIGKKNARIIGYFKQLLGKTPDVFIGWDCREPLFKEALSFKPNKTNNQDNILDMASYWQQVIEKYEMLIALPHNVDMQEYSSAKVREEVYSF